MPLIRSSLPYFLASVTKRVLNANEASVVKKSELQREEHLVETSLKKKPRPCRAVKCLSEEKWSMSFSALGHNSAEGPLESRDVWMAEEVGCVNKKCVVNSFIGKRGLRVTASSPSVSPESSWAHQTVSTSRCLCFPSRPE